MTTKVNKAFEKWFGETYNDLQFNKAGMIDAWQAATKASESEINSLKQKVEELEKDRNEWYKDSQDRRLRIIELTASNNQLIDRCKNIVADDALAITFQSMGAYRSAIIKQIGELKAIP